MAQLASPGGLHYITVSMLLGVQAWPGAKAGTGGAQGAEE